MCDEHRPDDVEAAPPAVDVKPEPIGGPELVEVALVVPAAAYEAIDTLDDPPAAIDPARIAGTGAIRPPAEAREEPSRALIDAMARFATDLAGRLDRLQVQIERELRAESSREKVVDRLHAELQEYKNDLLLRITRPIFIDLIQLHDDMGKMAETLDDARTAGLLLDFQRGIEDVLYRQGVEPFEVAGESFDPRRQRAVSTVATDEPDRNKTIAARVRPGFASGEKVIRPELVSVHALKRAPTVEPEAPSPDP